MEKLIKVSLLMAAGFIAVKFTRWIFAITPGDTKYYQFGLSTFGFNVIEAIIVVCVVILIFMVLLKKE